MSLGLGAIKSGPSPDAFDPESYPSIQACA
jgi:hypothetical protein